MRPAEASGSSSPAGLWLVVPSSPWCASVFNVDYRFSFVQVIWAIGGRWSPSRLLLSSARRACLALGAAMIAGTTSLDGVHADRLGGAGWLWHVLHQPGRLTPLEGTASTPRTRSSRGSASWPRATASARGWSAPPPSADQLLRAGAVLTAGFVSLRALNVYGDPQRWRAQPRTGFTPSFLDCEKYPPSLLYLLMTLGPALLAWGALTGRDLARAKPSSPSGACLFYYALHLPLLHAMAGA